MADKIAVLGAGSWGIAIANLLDQHGHSIRLWEFNKADYEAILTAGTHPDKLPGVKIRPDILITNILEEALSGVELIVIVVPSQKVRTVCTAVNGLLKIPIPIVNLAKGVEIDSLLRMSEVIKDTIEAADDSIISTLSGPSHAEEVARGIPTSVVAASLDESMAERIQKLFNSKSFRVYRSKDLVGVELGGSLKNVVAIASGIVYGLGLGDNTIGALITRGQAEIARIGLKLGANPKTFAGLSGIGDLITTCVSTHSRNRFVGEKIGRGEKLDDILSKMVMVAEGVYTCQSAHAMAKKYGVEMPITEEVYRVLFEDKSPSKATADLMGRALKEEVWN
jgi:glycerol-3-phosphate dehydrogenase (NAD(P)+)